MQTPHIQITQDDFNKLQDLLRNSSPRPEDKKCYEALAQELAKAEIKSPGEISPDVITLNSRARLWDLGASEHLELTIVLPELANASEALISVLAPLGTAMLGYRKGDIFTWNTPGGENKFWVEEILFQPEATNRSQVEESES